MKDKYFVCALSARNDDEQVAYVYDRHNAIVCASALAHDNGGTYVVYKDGMQIFRVSMPNKPAY